MTIAVLVPGALTTFQDLGRAGNGASGVPVSGAFDAFALRAANRLVGNADGAPALEITMAGPTLRFEIDARIALTGSRFAAMLDKAALPHARTVEVRAGQTLKVGWTTEGARAYLAIAGLISEERTLGSVSRHVAAQLGPPPLESGDVLVVGMPHDSPLRTFAEPWSYSHEIELRAVRGAQWSHFAPSEIFGATFAVTQEASRTGVRLDGPPIEHRSSGEIDPEGVTPGAVQVPPNGRAIVLGPDGPATGGYPKIAHVIAADLFLLAHAKPGDAVRFSEVSVDDARTAWADRERALDEGFE